MDWPIGRHDGREREWPLTPGRIMVYARRVRWRRALAHHLTEAGHSYQEAATPEDVRRLLFYQRFDVLAASIRDREDARALAEALEGVALPPHGILVGGAGACLLSMNAESGRTLRFVPALLASREVGHLVEAILSAGTCPEGATGGVAAGLIEDVDVEELIERAASAVYAEAQRKRQRFSSVVEGPIAVAVADPSRLHRAVVALLRLSVVLAPRGVRVLADARGDDHEWSLRIRASGWGGRPGESLREQRSALDAIARELRPQGRLVWAELLGVGAFALCLRVPLVAQRGERRGQRLSVLTT